VTFANYVDSKQRHDQASSVIQSKHSFHSYIFCLIYNITTQTLDRTLILRLAFTKNKPLWNFVLD